MKNLWELINEMVLNGDMNEAGLKLVKPSLNFEQYNALEDHVLREGKRASDNQWV